MFQKIFSLADHITQQASLMLKGTSLGHLLESIGETLTAKGVSKEDLLWYCAKTINSWGDLTYHLRKAFLPCDCGNILWDEIR